MVHTICLIYWFIAAFIDLLIHDLSAVFNLMVDGLERAIDNKIGTI